MLQLELSEALELKRWESFVWGPLIPAPPPPLVPALKVVLLHRLEGTAPPAPPTLPLTLQIGLKDSTGSLPAQEQYF